MTEVWKSNAMHWCDVCKCWLVDSKQSKLNHERGAKHQENLTRKLRDMAKKADEEKRNERNAATAMEKIEQAAQRQFDADRRAMEEEGGKWVWDATSKYYYNAKFRWYYDPANPGWYYGGYPVAWTEKPDLPEVAMFGAALHEGGPVPQGATAIPSAAAPSAAAPASQAAARTAATASSSATASTSGGESEAGKKGLGTLVLSSAPSAASLAPGTGTARVVQKVVAVAKHPLADVGGYQAPLTGKVGGAKGVGTVGADAKRPRDEATGTAKASAAAKAEDPAEAAARARREAARQRVQQRTAAGFGYV